MENRIHVIAKMFDGETYEKQFTTDIQDKDEIIAEIKKRMKEDDIDFMFVKSVGAEVRSYINF